MANTVNHFTRKYLTSYEIGFIVNEMLNKDNAVEREIVKVGLVAQLTVKDLVELTDEAFKEKFEDCNGVYDYIMEKGIDLTKIVNYNDIDRLVNEELGVNKVIRDFVVEFENKISKSLEGLDLNKAIGELKELAEKDKDLTNMSKEEFDKKFNSDKQYSKGVD
jgi:hypothetical protein